MVGIKLKKLPKVSILLPTKDPDPNWLRQAFESVAKQDYQGEFEIIVVNHNCRLSKTKMIGDLLNELFPNGNFTYIKVDIDELILSQILNIGIDKCTGEIIIRMDHDDIARPNLISKQVEFLLANPDIQISGVQLQFFGEQNYVTNHPPVVDRIKAYQMQGYWVVNHPGIAMRKDTLIKVGMYDESLPKTCAQDYDLWIKYLNAGYLIANLPDVLIDYRSHAGQASHNRDTIYLEYLKKAKESLTK